MTYCCCLKYNLVPVVAVVVVVVVVVVVAIVVVAPIVVVLMILFIVQFSGGFTEDHPCIISFWRVVDQFTDTQKRQLLKFVTSCSRPPLLGFKVGLEPIHRTTFPRLERKSG